MNLKISHVWLALITIVLLVTSVYLINRYFYSVAGETLKKADLCDFKSVSIYGETSFVRLSFDFDTENIANEMSKKDGYVVKRISKYDIDVKKKFETTTYKISLRDLKHDNKGGFGVGTYTEWKNYPEAYGGEKCSTPDYVLRNKIESMIDDLPLDESQKKEMKEKIFVAYVSQFKPF